MASKYTPSRQPKRLREAFQVAPLLALVESPDTARAWRVGMNLYFDERSLSGRVW